MSSGQIPAEVVWIMFGLALAAVLILVVVGIGLGGTIFTLAKRDLPASRHRVTRRGLRWRVPHRVC